MMNRYLVVDGQSDKETEDIQGGQMKLLLILSFDTPHYQRPPLLGLWFPMHNPLPSPPPSPTHVHTTDNGIVRDLGV